MLTCGLNTELSWLLTCGLNTELFWLLTYGLHTELSWLGGCEQLDGLNAPVSSQRGQYHQLTSANTVNSKENNKFQSQSISLSHLSLKYQVKALRKSTSQNGPSNAVVVNCHKLFLAHYRI